MTPALAAYLQALTTRCEQATKGPWDWRWSFVDAGVNDGSFPDWPVGIRRGTCAYCGNKKAVLVREYKDEQGRSLHQHRFPSDVWHDIVAFNGKLITGNYDYEEGGVLHEEDATFIAHAREDLPTLVRLVRDAHETLEQIALYASETQLHTLKTLVAEALARAEGIVKEGG